MSDEEYNRIKNTVQTLYSVYEDSKFLKTEHSYLNGVQHGYFREWYPDGKLKHEHHYKNGNYHGTRKSWYPNGNLHYFNTYLNDVNNGLTSYYREDGSYTHYMFYVNNTIEGEEIENFNDDEYEVDDEISIKELIDEAFNEE